MIDHDCAFPLFTASFGAEAIAHGDVPEAGRVAQLALARTGDA
jgi:hypothetical protein